MNITKTELFEGCLIASLAHAIMTNVYPELSYEVSWDGTNFSMQDSSGMRGTITFENNYCVGAVRNIYSGREICGAAIQNYMGGFPPEVVQKAYEEAFQYLLLNENGIVSPHVTSVFWADDRSLYYDKKRFACIKEEFSFFESIFLPRDSAIQTWKEYYDMDLNAVALVRDLLPLKLNNYFSQVELSPQQAKLIPGTLINDKCVESFKEMNIVLGTGGK